MDQMMGQMPGEMMGQMPGEMMGQMPGEMMGQMPGGMMGQMPGGMMGQMPGEMMGQMPGQMGQMQGQMGGQTPSQVQGTQAPQVGPDGMLPVEQSYVENILRFNRGKMARVYQTFEYNPEWPARVFTGVIEAAGRDHIILSNPETGRHYLLLMVNLDYVEFEEPIEYVPPQLPAGVQTIQDR
ncbi:spore coat protein GerQ [Caldalkalibacillus salinus]|uniref:spore coat protein GerQ n=1 Tax=Caldalkalibacillus salinus TaxID=2803787 RepID=UPI003AFF72C0